MATEVSIVTGATQVSLAGAIPLVDDQTITFGDVAKLLWETADANANVLLLSLPVGGAVDVPGFVIGDNTALNADLGLFNGVTQPFIAVVDDPATAYIQVGFNANAAPMIKSANSIILMPSGDTDDYLTFSTLTNVPTIFGTGAYVRIGDAAFTSQSLASEDDLMVSGKLEVDGAAYFDAAVHLATPFAIDNVSAGDSVLTLGSTAVSLRGTNSLTLEAATSFLALRPLTGQSINFQDYNSQVNYTKFMVVRVQKAYTADLFNAVGLTDSVVIWSQPANTVLKSIKMRLVTQFAAVGMTDLDVTLGDAGDNDGLVVKAMNLTSDATTTEYATRGAYWDTSAKGAHWYSAAGQDWTAYATAVGANLSTLTAGQLDFYIIYEEA